MGVYSSVVEQLRSFSLWGSSSDGLPSRPGHAISDFLDIDGPLDSSSSVTYSNALGLSAVYSCVKVISEDISIMDIGIETKTAEGYWIKDEKHYLNDLFRNPAPYKSMMDITEVATANAALSGNGFLKIQRDRDGRPNALELKEFQEVQILQDLTRTQIIYQVTMGDGRTELYYPWEVFHLKGFSLNGHSGLSPINQLNNTLSISLQANGYANETYSSGGYGGGIITHPSDLSAKARANISSGVRKTQASRQYPVLDEGMKFTPNRMSPADIDFINTQKHTKAEINAAYRVALHLTMLNENGSKSGTEDDSLNHMNRCLLPWVKRWENEMEQKFLSRDERKTTRVVFNLDSFHRASTSARMDYMKGLALMQLKTINELRAMSGDPPVPDGDRFVDFQKSRAQDQIGQISKNKNDANEPAEAAEGDE